MASLARLTTAVRPGTAICLRSLSTGVFRPKEVSVLPGYTKRKEIQKQFQIDNGQRIHERGGPTNKMLHIITTVITLAATVEFLRVVFTLSYPGWEIPFLYKK